MDRAPIEAEEAKNLSADDLIERLSSSRKGLSRQEAEERLRSYGYNEIAEKRENPLLKFLGFFWGPIPWMIEAAAVLSAVIRHWEDFGLIVVLLALNAVVGYYTGAITLEEVRREKPAKIYYGANTCW